jgi:hypothetical protein
VDSHFPWSELASQFEGKLFRRCRR